MSDYKPGDRVQLLSDIEDFNDRAIVFREGQIVRVADGGSIEADVVGIFAEDGYAHWVQESVLMPAPPAVPRERKPREPTL